MSRGVIWAIAALVLLFVTGAAAIVVGIAWSVVALLDRSDAHVCGLAAVRRSPAAALLVGQPIVQRGFTGGSTSSANGETTQRVTFTVGGPLGEAFVVAEGSRSPVDSSFRVRVGRNGRGTTIYSGPFDCPELHGRSTSRTATRGYTLNSTPENWPGS